MSTHRALALGLSFAALAACGGDLDPAWKVKDFRILGASIENLDRPVQPTISDAAPGERVRLRLLTADNRESPRAVQAAWVFCAEVTRVGNTFGCSRAGAAVALGTEVEYRIPTGVTYAIDTQGRSRIQVLTIACSGTLAIDPATQAPSCTGEGAVSKTMTRSILVLRPDEGEAPNRNPVLREVVAFRGAGDIPVLDPAMPLRLPRCTGETCTKYTLELRPAEGSRERYMTLNNQAQRVTTSERLVFGFFTTLGTFDGTFRVDNDVVPEGTIRNTLEAPRTAGAGRLWFSAQDPRGGVTVIERTVVFE